MPDDPTQTPAPEEHKAGDDWDARLLRQDLAPFWLSAIIESAEDAVISKSLEGVILSWNRGAERIFGYTAEEAVGKHVTMLIPEDHIDEEPAILARLRAGDRIEHYETIRRHKDGTLLDISLTVSPIVGPGGHVVGASKIARNITDQRRAQRALNEAAERLNLALAAARLGDWSWDAATDVVTLSDTAAEIFGVPPGPHLTWAQLRDLLHEDDRERARVAVEQAAAEQIDYDIEYRVVGNGDGEKRWVLAKGRALYDDSGRVTGMLGVVQDITDRKLTVQTLREQSEALSTTNELGRVISAELDLHNIVQAVTDAATELTGARFGSFFYNVLDERGASYMLFTLSGVPREAFAHFPMPRNTDIFAPTFKGEGTVRIGDVHKDPRYGKNSPYYGMPEGHLPVVSYLAVPVVSRSGDVVGGLFFGHPEEGVFTERHERIVEGMASQAAIAMDNARLYEAAQRGREQAERAAEENEKLYHETQEANRLKDEFLAMLSHELRTPLTAILGWAHMLRTGQFDENSVGNAYETIERNARAQAQLIDDLLDVSRIITGKLRLDMRAVNPNNFIDSAVEALRPGAESKGVRIRKIMDTGVISVAGDPVRLQQIVWNLLSNAVKFTPRGGLVQVRLSRVNSHVEIAVSDTGQGISTQFLPHVFDRFRQADQKITRQHGGLGLGLSIVRHLVELHGGTVRADSEGEGRGSTFTVMLPVAPVYMETEAGERVHPAARDTLPTYECPDRLDGLKILIVDDERDTLEMLRIGLSNCGAEVTVAGSAADALEAISSSVPDVVISDIGMPEMDGYELMRKIRALPAESGGRVPSVALTAYARTEDRLQALRSGYQMHVPKPVELAELVAVTASLAQRSK
ncbi:MAG TPA: PAS domain S-box protein [Pyrinomonadaceae bacterium]|jgi:PAS domain S-box-containing protein|nr:PAS domain S-box protein [Pyrinomonadaceae bacterium]